jgi:hypothetical protein
MANFAATIGSLWTDKETFSYLADFSNAQQWDPGVISAERLADAQAGEEASRLAGQETGRQADHRASAPVNGDAAGPVQVGSRFRLLVPFLGRRLALVYRVTALSCEHSVDYRDVTFVARHPLLLARDRITVSTNEPVSLDSVVTYQAEVSLRGPLRLLDPLLSRGFRSVGQRAANGLAKVLQTEPPASAESHPSPEKLESPALQSPDQPRQAS